MLQKQKVNIAFRIYLTISGCPCVGERSFIELKRIKNLQKFSISQGKLSTLALGQ